MARIQIAMPAQFSFTTEVTVRIRDINYGGHLDNAALLSLFHEARVRYLGSLGCTELDACGTSLIMTDAAIVYKGESFQGDRITIQIAAGELTSRGFALFYQATCERDAETTPIAHARTGMLCFNYQTRKVAFLPEALHAKLSRG